MTSECIDSIFSNTKDITFEVILVDNASTDGSVDFFKKDRRILFVESTVNLGFGRANNLGYNYAKGEYIFILNSDTLFLNNVLKLFFEKMNELDSTIACAGSILRNKELEIVCSYGKFPSIYRSFLELCVNPIIHKIGLKFDFYNYKKSFQNDLFEVDFIIGADLFIRRSAIEKCGMFDPLFFMYYEDTDLQMRYNSVGLKSVIIKGPDIIHLVSASITSIDSYKKLLLRRIIPLKSNFIYIKKWNSLLLYLLYRIVVFAFRLPIIFNPKHSWKDKKAYINILISNV